MASQLAIDLFPMTEADREESRLKAIECHRRWMLETRGFPECALSVFDDLVERFGVSEAIDRSKALGFLKLPDYTLDDIPLMGIFTAPDYHTCWDRVWAAKHGIAKQDVARIEHWGYGLIRHARYLYKTTNGIYAWCMKPRRLFRKELDDERLQH